jgi:predicted DNA-binding transcriptional regulator AlpA
MAGLGTVLEIAMSEEQRVHSQMHQGFLTLKEVLPLVRMKRTNWYAKMEKGLVPVGQLHPLGRDRIYTVEEIDALLRWMEAERQRDPRGRAKALDAELNQVPEVQA